MNSTLKKIVIPLVLVVLLPAISYSVYEVTSLNETEKVIQEIYVNQLDAILNSVNQYSDMVVNSWVNEINSNLQKKSGDLSTFNKSDVKDLLARNKSILQIYMFPDSIGSAGISVKRENATDEKQVLSITENNKERIDRLFRYIKADYRKVEPLQSSSRGNQFLAVLLNISEKNMVAVLEIQPSNYINEVLKQAILEAGGDEFTITCNSASDENRFNFDESVEGKQPEVKSNLWLLPNYELGIILKGRTLKGLIAERTYTNSVILLIMNIIIIFGVLFIYRTIRKEFQLTQIKSDFVSNVSHELRTPLALISMFSETLEMGRVKNEEKRNEYYRIISQESNRLSRIVNSILSFSKIEAGKRNYNYSVNDLNNLLQKICDNYKFHLENKSFHFKFEPGENLKKIKIDAEAVSEAVINLIDNATKYSDENKEITIKTFMQNDHVVLEIKDRGIGISNEDQKKIFDKFFRVSTGLVHDTKGTGLGLTIVKHVIDAHKASIEIESKVGVGSSFKIYFNSVM